MSGTTLSVDPQKTAEILETAGPLEWTDFGGAGCESERDASATQQLEARVELGRTDIGAEDVERLVCGSVVRLDDPVEHPVGVYADHQLIAQGELMVVDGRYALRITETFTG